MTLARRIAVLDPGVGQGVGVVVGFVPATVETVLEQAHLGFEVGETLLQFGFPLLNPRRGDGLRLGLGLGEEFLELGFPQEGTLVKSLVEAGLLPRLPESQLAGGQAARGSCRDGFEGVRLHNREYAESVDRGVGW
jgi:hypothetical protein